MKSNNVRSGQVIKKINNLLVKKPGVITVTVIFLLFFQTKIMAQSSTSFPGKSITPYYITICYNKTSNFIFPYAIKSVDRGSDVLLVQRAKGIDNILQVKAGSQGFPQTNLTVVTTDGQLYSFLVDYAADPSALTISFIKDSLDNSTQLSEKDKALLSGEPFNEAASQSINQKINQQRHFLHIRSRQQKMLLALQSIWLKNKIMWLGLELMNKSLIDYTPSFIRFFARDNKRSKRTATQEMEIIPIYKNADSVVAGEQSQKKVFAFQPFTLPKTQSLIIQVGEQNGGRLLTLKVSHKAILKARLL